MRWTRTLIQTLRDNPTEAEIPSHKLMIRASMIRKLTSGVYNYLPLGWLSLQKAMNLVREEMLRAGAVEVLLPVLQPIELWQESGRAEDFGPLMCKFKDRNEHLNVLGPTHEEVITTLVRNEVSSYRQLPITLFQLQVKFRDEIRPRFGVMRSREFIMKDAYSFDIDETGLEKSYQAQYEAYCRIFERAGLNYKPVEADTGLMGGSHSHEFMIPCQHGEDKIASCKKCGYCANSEKAECFAPPQTFSTKTVTQLALEKVQTPNVRSVEELSSFLGISPSNIVKTLIFKSLKTGEFIAAIVRGDHEVNLSKLSKACKIGSLELAQQAEVEEITKGPFGFSGPVGLNIQIVCDLSCENMQNFVAGSNAMDQHIVNVNLHRDFTPTMFADIRAAKEGDLCTRCMAQLEFSNATEVGHLFKLGTKYSQAMWATFINDQGQQKPMVMGCYGIGINRIVGSAIEIHHDSNGIIWPLEIAPYQVVIVAINPKDQTISKTALSIYDKLRSSGVDVLLDDRDQTAGVKFADSDLIGFPVRVTVGSKTLAENNVDIKLRNKSEQYKIGVDSVVDGVKKAIMDYKL